MFSLKTVVAAAAIATLGATSSFAATLYNATSNVKEGAGNHSLWFSGGSNPDGAIGPAANHFKFENLSPGFGLFEVNGSTASLTGDVANANGQAFRIEMYFTEYTGTAFGLKTIPGGPNGSDWTLYDLDTTKSNTISYISGTGGAALQSFNVSLRGGNSDGPYKVQVGVGANDKDASLFGLSSWITLTDQDSSCIVNCSYAGDINIVLEPVPLPAAGVMLLAGMGGLFAMRRRKKAA
ncbi:MAG: VPLPA-CTERM sorting domain-containing protein [Pseudomonadota bacterium]